ncbi:MAG: glycosyltransferase family 4 protein [Colwellia sp.]|nr:glycosyltransferase family 4 protein [Colwellia sp.]
MKVLWITNTLFPDICDELNLPRSVAGGWMYGLGSELSSKDDVDLLVATPTTKVKSLQYIKKGNITYCLIPGTISGRYNTKLEDYWLQLNREVKPDLIHIHGTEYAHGLAFINKNPESNFVVSIQGLVKEYYHYYNAGLSITELIKNFTLKDIITLNPLVMGKWKFKVRGGLETQYFKKVSHVIGRTDWDYVHSVSENPKLSYHFCNESLRESFYTSAKWKFNTIEKQTIFLSQAAYPIKGLHMVLKALAILKDKFPSIQLRVAGMNLIDSANISGYGKLIKKLIVKHGLIENITFVGFLDTDQMVNEYLNASVFVCPSSIENSPNSVGEAQILGVPVIAADVGGVLNMVEHNSSGLVYRFEEYKLLAHYIEKLFVVPSLVKTLSHNGIICAEKRHNRETNTNKTLEIYNKICNR